MTRSACLHSPLPQSGLDIIMSQILQLITSFVWWSVGGRLQRITILYLLRGFLIMMMAMRMMLAMTPIPPRLVRITAEILSDCTQTLSNVETLYSQAGKVDSLPYILPQVTLYIFQYLFLVYIFSVVGNFRNFPHLKIYFLLYFISPNRCIYIFLVKFSSTIVNVWEIAVCRCVEL